MRGVERLEGIPLGGSPLLRRWSRVALAAALAASAACGTPGAEFKGRVEVDRGAPAQAPPEPSAPASIGTATMLEDGTIVMTLTAIAPSGARGEGRFTYKPGDRDYDAVLQHLGALAPGQSVPVPPWPDDAK